jgi:hypothetical protein
MISKGNRRAVLGAGVASVSVMPAVAKPALGRDDLGYQRALDLWNRWRKQSDLHSALARENAPEERLYTELEVLDEIEDALRGDMGASVHAVAAALMIKMSHGGLEEIVADIHLAALAAIRPQLVGAIAEAADRVLAQKKEEGA